MASVDDVARQVDAAMDKASKCRVALARADDLVEDAHDELARALRNPRYADLVADVGQMLAGFDNVRADMRALFRTLDAGRAVAERVLSALRGEVTPKPGPDAQRPAQPPQQPPTAPPPARQAEPADPPAVSPDKVEELRRELPPPVVRGAGQKTHGRWIGSDGTVQEIVSGNDARTALVNQQLAARGWEDGTARDSDVEMKLAADMVANGIRHATVIINNVPCKGRLGCDTLVPILLPEGATLTVYGITQTGTRTRIRYTGGAEPWWR